MEKFLKNQQIPLTQVIDPSTGQAYYAPQNVVYDDKVDSGPTYLRDVIVDQAVSSSYFSGSITNAISASYALTASYVVGFTASSVSSSYALSASYAATASYAFYAETASSALNAQDILIYVKNQSGAPIAKGVVVHITASGNSSDIPRVITASYENDNNSANTLGITNQSIANGAEGFVMTEGVLKGINTNAFQSGQLIYLGPTGSIIGYAPTAPLHSVRLGQVVREQSNNGSIYVRIDNGYELGELHDVVDTTTTSSYGDLLVKSGSVWINSKQLTGSYGLTGSLTATSFTGSLFGTASYALSASFAPSTPAFPYTGSARITGSLGVTGSISTSGSNGTINSLFIGRGNGNVSTNVSIGATTNFSSSATGTNNTAIGSGSLQNLTTANNNTAIGRSALQSNTTGNSNTAIGCFALYVNTTGGYNTAIGPSALQSNSSGCHNTAIGRYALRYNTTGQSNTAIGCYALRFNTNGNNNTAIGYYALRNNANGNNNTAIGNRALRDNTIGQSNTAIGQYSLRNNTTGGFNTAIGPSALQYNTTGVYNIAIGNSALYYNTIGQSNTAIGRSALFSNTTGFANVAIGCQALVSNTTGNYNTAIGYRALLCNTTGGNNTAIGHRALCANTTGNTNITLGYKSNGAISSSNNNIVIGTNIGVAESSANKINIGGLLFGSGSYANTSSAVFSGSSNGFVGINQPNPQYNLDLSGSLRILQSVFLNQNTASLASGNQTISTNATGSFTSAFYNYTLASGSNARSGQVMSVWNGGSIQFNDVATLDIGSTLAVALTASLSAGNVLLSTNLPSSGWTIKTIVNLI